MTRESRAGTSENTLKRDGEPIRVTASVGGRRLTLDPLAEHTLPIQLREVESTIPCGFQIDWVSGEKGDEEYRVAVGAGMGSEWATIHYKGKEYCFSARSLLDAFFAAVDK